MIKILIKTGICDKQTLNKYKQTNKKNVFYVQPTLYDMPPVDQCWMVSTSRCQCCNIDSSSSNSRSLVIVSSFPDSNSFIVSRVSCADYTSYSNDPTNGRFFPSSAEK